MVFKIFSELAKSVLVIICLAGFFSFLGCKGLMKSKTEVIEHGPFTIERVNKYGKRYDINTASSRDNSRSYYKLFYKGELVAFPPSLSDNLGVSGIWKMFILSEAPKPTVLVGSKAVYLVSEENSGISIVPLSEQSSDFASLIWLDSNNGQPGIKQEIYSSDDTGKDGLFSGGRFLLINKFTVLDVYNLDTYHFQLNRDYTEEYSPNSPISFSPDKNKIVYLGSQYSGKYYYAIIVLNFKTNEVQTIPFDRNELRLNEPYDLPSDWFQNNFTWKDDGNGELALNRIQRDTLLPWVGYFTREKNYSIAPVKIEMLPFFVEFVRNFLKLSESDVKLEQYASGSNYTFKVGTNMVELRYFDDSQTVYFSDHILDDDEEGYQAILKKVGEAFNKELKEGKHQDFFTQY